MANRYWVGGTATWDGTAGTKWALTSGGAGGEAVPTSADDVFFDAASGAVTVTTSGTTVDLCNNLTFTGFTGTFSHAASTTVQIYGNLVMAAGMTYTLGGSSTSRFTFKSTTTGKTITTAGKEMGASTFDGVGGEWTLQDNWNAIAGIASMTLTNGSLVTGNKNISVYSFSSSNSNIRSLTLGSSVITIETNFSTNTSTNLTLSAGTSTLTFSGGSTGTFSGGGLTYYNFSSLSLISASNLTLNNITFNNFTISNGSGASLVLFLSGSLTVNGTFTVTGNNATTRRMSVVSSVIGTPRTITANAVSLTNVSFGDITGAGTAAPFTGTSIGDLLGNSGITMTTPTTRYWVGNSGNWSDTAHWSASSGGSSGASVPLPQDNVIVNASSITIASQTITMDMSNVCKDINFTGVANSPVLGLGTSSREFFGNVTFVSGMSMTGGTGGIFLSSRTSATLTSGGVTIPSQVVVNDLGNYSLGSDLTLTTTTSVQLNPGGTFTAGTYNVTARAFIGSTAPYTLNMGSGTWTFIRTAVGNVFAPVAGATINAQTSTIVVSDTSTIAKTFAGTGYTFNTLTVTGDNVIISGSNTFSTLNVNNAGMVTGLFLTSGTTQTVTTFSTNGSAGNLAKIASTSAGSAATLSKSSGIVSENYMSLQDNTATGGAVWYAGPNTTNVSGNTGWSFIDPPADITKSAQYKVYNTPTPITLNDSFDDNSIDGAKWGVISPGSGRYAETGGRLEITSHTVSGTYDGLYSLTNYNFTGKSAYVELVNAGNQSIAGLQAVLKFYIDASNSVALWVGGGSIHAQQQVSGTYTDLFSVAYNATNHRWLRVVEYDGITYWQVSANGTTWNELYHKANPIAVTALYPEISAGVYQTETLTTTTIWNNFNITTVDYDITKTASYVVVNVTDIPKTAQYTVISASDISKVGQYTVTRNIDLTKSSEYRIARSTDITKSAQYVPIFSTDITKNADYTVHTDFDITKPAAYTIRALEILDSSYLKTLKIGKKYGPITSVILGRVPQNDNVVIASKQPQANIITSIDTGTNLFTIVGHSMEEGNLVRVASTGDIPAPLLADTNYYAYTNGSADTFALAYNYADALTGSNLVDITTSGTGTVTLSHIETQEVQINNNQIMDDDRQDLLPPIYEQLVGLEWNEVKADTVGLGWHEVGDVVIFTQGATSVYGFLDEVHLVFDGSIRESLTSTIPDVSTINYQTAGGIIKTIYNTEIKVDKQQNEITSVVSQQDVYATETQENFSQVYQDIDNIDLTIQKSGGGNLIKNSVGFATESATDFSSVQYDKFSFWDYNASYDTVTDGVTSSYSSSESQNAGGTSGQVIKMIGSDIFIKQRISVAVNTELSFGLRVNNAIGAGDATITLSNDNDTFTITVDDSNQYIWEELTLENFVSSQSWLDLKIQVSSATNFEFTDMRLLYGTTIQGWVQSPSEILSANVQFTTLGMRIFDNVHDTTTQVTYNEFSTRRKSDDVVLFEADDTGVVTNDLTIKSGTNYNSGTDTVIRQVTIPESSALAGIAFIKVS